MDIKFLKLKYYRQIIRSDWTAVLLVLCLIISTIIIINQKNKISDLNCQIFETKSKIDKIDASIIQLRSGIDNFKDTNWKDVVPNVEDATSDVESDLEELKSDINESTDDKDTE